MIVLGQFKETYNNEKYPSIYTAICNEPHPQKGKILAYLKSRKASAVSPGFYRDVIDNKTIINSPKCYTDGTYLWRSDTIYYFEKYNLRLNQDFIDHVMASE